MDNSGRRATDLFDDDAGAEAPTYRDHVSPTRDELDGLGLGAGRTEGDLGRQDPSGRRREKKRNRTVLVAALVLLLVPVLAVGGYLAYLNHLVSDNVKQELLLPDTNNGPTDKNGAAVAQPTGTGTNYLIIGNDAGPDRVGARSDVMVLVHVPEDHSRVTLVHFPRDLYVSIPGRGKNKLNAAYAFGGAPLLVTTMQNMLGIRVDHVAVLGFEGFKAMTDAVGGVDVRVEEPSKSNGYDFKVGTMHMTGDMGLAFVRERHQLSQGDISRGLRQLAFIKALMLKTLNKDVLLNPVRLSQFVDAATSNLTVDQKLDVGTMRSEALAMRGLRSKDIRFITAPFTGFGTSPDGASIDIVDDAKMADLGQAIRTDSLDSYS
ncbi:LCP family protein [Terrabacter aerolatus]|uniref:Transcriptional regulator n=1 Tax=Terrabacter aerolatus TaxID=422442 RepID=A0A512CZN3_9MICO|nr:LCP family protein [Terrabacter aerolatus]GEO29676.1 transcriptional regulator [Terrabacter aerolatus]